MIAWNDSFSVQNTEIDEQHKTLFSIMKNLGDLLVNKDFDILSVSGVVGQLDDYVRVHFSFEEQLMNTHNYSDKENHIAQHDTLRKKLDEINIFDVEDKGKFLNETLMYLVNWLTNHIMKTDKKFGQFLSTEI